MLSLLVVTSLLSQSPNPSLVGTWQGDVDRWTFRADGTGASLDDPKFRWKANAKTITITYPDNTYEPLPYQLKGDALVLSVEDDEGGKTKVALKRLDPEAMKPKPPQPAQAGLAGTWGIEGMKFVVLAADGTATLPSQDPSEKDLPGVWTADEKTIVILYANGARATWPYALKGATLTITDDGEKMPLKRLATAKK
jgi:hypothetical protein